MLRSLFIDQFGIFAERYVSRGDVLKLYLKERRPRDAFICTITVYTGSTLSPPGLCIVRKGKSLFHVTRMSEFESTAERQYFGGRRRRRENCSGGETSVGGE